MEKASRATDKNSRSRCSLSQTQVVLTGGSPFQVFMTFTKKGMPWVVCFSTHTPPMLVKGASIHGFMGIHCRFFLLQLHPKVQSFQPTASLRCRGLGQEASQLASQRPSKLANHQLLADLTAHSPARPSKPPHSGPPPSTKRTTRSLPFSSTQGALPHSRSRGHPPRSH